MGGYDLYGRYYPNEADAINAELAQMSEIDSHHTQEDLQILKSSIELSNRRLLQLEQKIVFLEERISFLENLNK